MIAEFEEKEFEGPLNCQLSLGAPMWTPGQVLEEIVGFDAALMTTNALLWAACGFTTPPPGAVIHPKWWRTIPAGRTPPAFLQNVFLQHKRPDYLSRSTASEWASWGRNYFRFPITSHQQLALEACASVLGNNGCVAYSSPVFHTRKDLFTHIEKQTLVAHTHFAPATPLSGHGCYTYESATAPGVAHSEPTVVEPLTFFASNGNDPPRRVNGGDGGDPAKGFEDARRAAEAAVAASPHIVGTAELYNHAVGRAMALRDVRARSPRISRVENDYIFAAMFSRMSGIAWHIWGAER